MLRSVRIKIGIEEYAFDTGRGVSGGGADGGAEALRPRDGVRMIRRLRADELRRLRGLPSFTKTINPRSNDVELRRVLAELIVSGRVQVRRIQPRVYHPTGNIPELLDFVPPAPVENEILETHGVMIELVDADGDPVPSEPFRIKLPDGTVETNTLDDEGKAHITGIEQAGTCKVCFYERDAAVWDPV